MFCYSQLSKNEIITSIPIDNNYNLTLGLNKQLIILKLDTGSAISTIDTIALSQETKQKLDLIRKENFKDILGNQKEYPVYKGLDFKINDFTVNSPEFIGTQKIKGIEFNCLLKIKSIGILGMNAFVQKHNYLKYAILLENEKSEIVILSDVNSNITNGYEKINSRFDDDSIFIEVTMAGKKVELLFDTGFNGFISLKKTFKELKKFKTTSFEYTPILTFANFSHSKETYINDVDIKIGNLQSQKNLISINKDFDVSLIGLETIKEFNWIIDFKDEEVYVKQIHQNTKKHPNAILKGLKNIVLAINGNLTILQSENSNYKTGSIIKSVNGEPVTPSNLCNLEKLLLEESISWDDLNLKF